MQPAARTFDAGGRTLTVRLNLGSIVTATRRFRGVLAEAGIANIFGPGSEMFFASAQGIAGSTLSSIEANAILACACLAENNPPILIPEWLELVDAYPQIEPEIEAEVSQFFRQRQDAMGGLLATFRTTVVRALAAAAEMDPDKIEALVSTNFGRGSDLLPSSAGDSGKMSSGDAQPQTSIKSTSDFESGIEPSPASQPGRLKIQKPLAKRGNAA